MLIIGPPVPGNELKYAGLAGSPVAVGWALNGDPPDLVSSVDQPLLNDVAGQDRVLVILDRVARDAILGHVADNLSFGNTKEEARGLD